MYVIYHADCLDGLAAAWLMHRRFPEATYIAAQYGDKLPELESAGDVWIVDFSYKAPQLIELCRSRNAGGRVVVCDHHKTAIDHLQAYWNDPDNGYPPENLRLCLDLKRSGAGIVWDVLEQGEGGEMPLLVKHIQDRDLWKFEFKNTRLITAAVTVYPLNFNTLYDLEKLSEEQLCSIGEVALQKDRRLVEWHLKHSVRMVIHEGNEIPLVNVPHYITSEVGNALAKDYPYVFLYYDGKYQRHVSLRSVQGADACVDEIAGQYGGGGHASAAGFKLPFTDRFWPQIDKPPRTPMQLRRLRNMCFVSLAVILGTLAWFATK